MADSFIPPITREDYERTVTMLDENVGLARDILAGPISPRLEAQAKHTIEEAQMVRRAVDMQRAIAVARGEWR